MLVIEHMSTSESTTIVKNATCQHTNDRTLAAVHVATHCNSQINVAVLVHLTEGVEE